MLDRAPVSYTVNVAVSAHSGIIMVLSLCFAISFARLPMALTPLSSQDVANWQNVFVQVGVDQLFYGVQAALSFAALSALAKKDEASRLPFIVIGALLISSTVVAGLCPSFYIVWAPSLFSASPSDVHALLARMNVVLSLTKRLNYLLSDLIVVWRAWVLWSGPRVARALLLVCMTGSVVGVLVELVWALEHFMIGVSASHTVALYVPLLVTNLVATALIGVQVWSYRRNIKRSLRGAVRAGGAARVETILFLLVESGVVYCGLWVAFLIIALKANNEPFSASTVMGNIFHSIAGIYPCFVVFVVEANKAKADRSVRSEKELSVLRFTPSPAVRENACSATTTTILVDSSTENDDSIAPADAPERRPLMATS
ncbi:hypothetical protein BD626DRAFT_124966 [Schizophyllum amplum]|uniref:Uncharacterized protein n=1 Tax=Schizophyllum amplum TaxID=97359 RepID=A0A550C6T1_9AGAR|nr:hypothetical protein BD626DRAFT_124966 [Auriculariopsis ampla]